MTALEVSRLLKPRKPGLHMVGGVIGLGLDVGGGESASWILRYKHGGKRSDAGLGSYPTVPLARAR
ncbi:MAG: Arm DNA-binding domain-containing protein, partial [Caldimonas sp.]